MTLFSEACFFLQYKHNLYWQVSTITYDIIMRRMIIRESTSYIRTIVNYFKY